MYKPVLNPTNNARLLQTRIDELRAGLHGCDPHVLCQKTGTTFTSVNPGAGFFEVLFWEQPLLVTFPEFSPPETLPMNPATHALILYYFQTADGAPLIGNWVSFADLPNGRFYNQAFQGYTGNELAKRYGGDEKGFTATALNQGGKFVDFGGIAYSFHLFPRVPVLVVSWQGDDDLPSTFRILFDASVSHYLPTDACAIAGSILTHRLLKSSIQ